MQQLQTGYTSTLISPQAILIVINFQLTCDFTSVSYIRLSQRPWNSAVEAIHYTSV